MDFDLTQAIPLSDVESDGTDDLDETKRPVAYIKAIKQKGFPETLYPIYNGVNLIGRGDTANVLIPLKALSKEHACIEADGDSILIYDKGSRNKTRRGKLFLKPSIRYELNDKDQLIFGDVKCEFLINDRRTEVVDDDIGIESDSGSETGSECLLQMDAENLVPTSTTQPGDTEQPILTSLTSTPADQKPMIDSEQPILTSFTGTPADQKPMIDSEQPIVTSLTSAPADQKPMIDSEPGGTLVEESFLEDQDTKATLVEASDSDTDIDEELPIKQLDSSKFVPDSQPTLNISSIHNSLILPTNLSRIDDSFNSGADEADQTETQNYDVPAAGSVEKQEESMDEIRTLKYSMGSDTDDEDVTGIATAHTQALAEEATQRCGDEDVNKPDVSTAPTQAYADDEAATQRYGNADVDVATEPTQAYTVPEAATQRYGDADETDEEVDLAGLATAPTQAYTLADTATQRYGDADDTDEEVDLAGLATAPTQAYTLGDAATQRYGDADDTDEEVDLAGLATAPTQAYTLGDEATQRYGDADGTDKEVDLASLATAPTQAYTLGDAATQRYGEVSDSEDGETASEGLATAPTLEYDVIAETESDGDEGGTYETEVATQAYGVMDEDDTACAPTLAYDKTQDNEVASNAKSDSDEKSEVVVKSDETAATASTPNNKANCTDKKNSGDEAPTHVFGKDDETSATQAFGNEDKTAETQAFGKDDETAEPQAFSKDGETSATQAFGNEDETSATQAFGKDDETAEPQAFSKDGETSATQAFGNEDETAETQAFGKDDETSATQAFGNEDETSATQAFGKDDETAEPQAFSKDGETSATQAFGNEDETSATQAFGKDDKTEETQAFSKDDETAETQAFGNEDETSAKQAFGNDDETAATQAFGNEDETAETQVFGNDGCDEKAIDTDSKALETNETGDTQVPESQETDELEIESLLCKPPGKSALASPNKKAKGQQRKSVAFSIPESKKSEEIIEKTSDSVSKETEDGGHSRRSGRNRRQSARMKEYVDQKNSISQNGKNGVAEVKDNTKTNQEPLEDVCGKSKTGKQKLLTDEEERTKKVQHIESKNGMEKEVRSCSIQLAIEDKEKAGNQVKHTLPDVGNEPLAVKTGGSSKLVKISEKKGSGGKKEVEDKHTRGKGSKKESVEETKEECTIKTTVVQTQKRGGRETRNMKNVQVDKEEEMVEDYHVKEKPTRENGSKKELVKEEKEEYTTMMTVEQTPRRGRTQTNSMKNGQEDKEEETVEDHQLNEKPTREKRSKKESVKEEKEEYTTKMTVVQTPRRGRTQTKSMKNSQEDKEEETIEDHQLNENPTREKGSKKESVKEEKEEYTTKMTVVQTPRRGRTQTKSMKNSQKDKEEETVEDQEVKEKHARGRGSKKELEAGEKDECTSKTTVIQTLRKGRTQTENMRNSQKDKEEETVEVKEKPARGRGSKRNIVEDDIEETNKETKQDTISKTPKGRRSQRNMKENSLEIDIDEPVEDNEMEEKQTKGKRSKKRLVKNETEKCTNNTNTEQNTVAKSSRGHMAQAINENVSEPVEDKEMEEKQTKGKRSKKRLVKNETDKCTNNTNTEQNTVAKSSRGHRAQAINENVSEPVEDKEMEEKQTKGKRSKKRLVKNETDKCTNNTNTEQNTVAKSSRGHMAQAINENVSEPVKEKLDEKQTKGKGSKQKLVVEKEEGECAVDVTVVQTQRRGRTQTQKKNSGQEEEDKEVKEKQTRGKGSKRKVEDESEECSTISQSKKGKAEISSNKITKSSMPCPSQKPNTKAAQCSDDDIPCSPSLRRRTSDSKPKIMFTGVVDESWEKIVKSLGGVLVTSIHDCTHLITDKIRRTVKFLCGLAKGAYLVDPNWLEESKTMKHFVNTDNFMIVDYASERQHGFSLKTSHDLALERRLFQDFKIHVTPSVKPDTNQMKDIVQCAGGEYISRMPNKYEDNLVVVSCEEDESKCNSALKAGIPVVSSEFILTGILRQEIDIQQYHLFVDVPNSSTKRKTGASAKKAATKRRK